MLATPANQAADTGTTWNGTARQNAHAYSLNDIISVQSKLFICTTAGTSAGSEPGGYATAADGDSITDSGAVFRAGWRQKVDATFTPQLKGWVQGRVCLSKVSTTVYVDPVLQ